MNRDYRKYTDEDIIEAASSVFSLAGMIRALGLIPAGGNYATVKKNLSRLNIDTAHWTGQGWSKGNRKDWSDYSRASAMKPGLVLERGHVCEDCKLTEWKGSPIPLELHHKDGDRTNNESNNLQLLCPNCHAVTDNWRGRAARKDS